MNANVGLWLETDVRLGTAIRWFRTRESDRCPSLPALPARPVALSTGAAEELRNGRAGPVPAHTAGDALGVEMVGDGLRSGRPRRLHCFDFPNDAPNEGLNLLSSLRHSLARADLRVPARAAALGFSV